MGGDRGGEVEDDEGSDRGELTTEVRSREEGKKRTENPGHGGTKCRGTGGQRVVRNEERGRILTRAPMGLRLRWMIEGKGPPWAQQR